MIGSVHLSVGAKHIKVLSLKALLKYGEIGW